MFGFSFGELLIISLVTLVAVGPQKLPGVLKTMGQWARKLRKMTLDVRQQTGIDEMLRAEGIQLSELRSLMRGYHPSSIASSLASPITPVSAVAATGTATATVTTSAMRSDDPYQGLEPDPSREYPFEGADAHGALPDDLLEPPSNDEVAAAPGAPDAEPASAPSAASPPPTAEHTDISTAAEPPAPLAAALSPAAVAPLSAAAPAAGTAAPILAAPIPTAASVPAAAPIPAATLPAPAAAAAGVSPPRPRSAPPPPPSRSGSVRPAASAPPPPPRRSVPPSRPEPSPASSNSDVAPNSALPSTPGSANGNG